MPALTGDRLTRSRRGSVSERAQDNFPACDRRTQPAGTITALYLRRWGIRTMGRVRKDPPCEVSEGTTRKLLAADLERTALGAGFPRARNRSMRQAQVLDLAVDDVGDGLPALILAVAFQVHEPPFGRERRVLDGDIVGAGIDRPGDRLPIPLQH